MKTDFFLLYIIVFFCIIIGIHSIKIFKLYRMNKHLEKIKNEMSDMLLDVKHTIIMTQNVQNIISKSNNDIRSYVNEIKS